MGSLDQLIEDTINPNEEDKEQKLQEVSDNLDDNDQVHSVVTVYHNVDGVNEYPSIAQEMANIESNISKLIDKEFYYNILNKDRFISVASVESLNPIFDNKILDKIPLGSYTELLTKVNANSTLKIAKEDIDSTKEKISTQVVDTFNKFEETYDELKDNLNERIDSINSEVKAINELISNKLVSNNPNRIMYIDDKEVDYGNAPLKSFLSSDEFDSIKNILTSDLVEFIQSSLDNSYNKDTDLDTDNSVFLDSLNIKTLENFYNSDYLDTGLSLLYSYVKASKDIIDECKKSATDGEFQYLMTKLPEAQDTIGKLRFANSVLVNLPKLNIWFIKYYKSIQDLL